MSRCVDIALKQLPVVHMFWQDMEEALAILVSPSPPFSSSVAFCSSFPGIKTNWDRIFWALK